MLGLASASLACSEPAQAPQPDEPPASMIPGAARYALALVDLGAGVDVTVEQARAAMFGAAPSDRSLASFYFESSYGKYSVVGDVVGPFRHAMTTCDLAGMARAIESQLTRSYDHVIFYFARTPLCGFGGLGEEGTLAHPARYAWMNGSLACASLMQESAHNLGLMHANTMTCPGASFSPTPATSCTIAEYGSVWTPMGNGCHQLNGYEKWYEGWLSGCNGVRVPSTGTFTLAPLGISSPGSVQVLQIPMPTTRVVADPQAPAAMVNLRNYYLELRAPAGRFDQYAPGGPSGGFTQPTVTVYASDDIRSGIGAPPDGGPGNSVWTELLNMNPAASDIEFGGLQVDVPFSDPSGSPTITLRSISATAATVEVTVRDGVGSPTCIDGRTLALLLPRHRSITGARGLYCAPCARERGSWWRA